MRHITFSITEEESKEFCGTYVVAELTAQQGIDAINGLVETKDDPKTITVQEVKLALIHAAATRNDKPFLIDFETIPHRLWTLLLQANERLNAVSDEEAAFLLKPSS